MYYYFWSLKGRDIFVTINISCNSCYNQVRRNDCYNQFRRRNGCYNRRGLLRVILVVTTKLVVTAYFLESYLKATDKLKFTAVLWFQLSYS